MPWPTTVLDAEGAARDWVNSLTGTLSGAGRPLELGAHLRRLRSPFRGSYLLLTRVGGGPDPGEEVNLDRARISGSAYGVTKQTAAAAAVANAKALAPASVTPGVAITGGRLMVVTDITGPLYLIDGDEERYIVDAVFHLQPS
jgi:hypothetical protein